MNILPRYTYNFLNDQHIFYIENIKEIKSYGNNPNLNFKQTFLRKINDVVFQIGCLTLIYRTSQISNKKKLKKLSNLKHQIKLKK